MARDIDGQRFQWRRCTNMPCFYVLSQSTVCRGVFPDLHVSVRTCACQTFLSILEKQPLAANIENGRSKRKK